ncbi:peroxiredoxin family protein [Natronorubrum sp. FCH18a]|uniref:peroxiredoxin family protein n=1 Tax=Natronorubrum sp. FCH18a TaxID=3447018 RepID=UPI003F513072
MLEEGDSAPNFALPSTAGGEKRLSETITTGPTVLVFFRGHWCSYCAEQLQTFSSLSYDLWRHLQVDVLPITGDPIPDLTEMRDRFDLRIQLLSDPELDVTEQYTSTETHTAIGDKQSRGRIPIPTTMVVDTDRVVRYVQVADDPTDRTYANYVRHFIRTDFTEPYVEE